MLKPREVLLRLSRYLEHEENRNSYLRLDKNEFIVPFPEEILRQIREAISGVLIQAYPEESFYKKKAAEFFNVSNDSMLFTAGSDGAIRLVYETFLDPLDRVMHLEPTYGMNAVYARLMNAVGMPVTFDEQFNVNLQTLYENLHRAKIIYIANPNSPTGTVILPQVLEDVIRKAQKKSVLVFVDEAYYPYYGSTVLELINTYDNLIVTRSFSKALGMAGLRLGTVFSNPTNIEFISRCKSIYDVNVLALVVADILTHNMDIINKIYTDVIKGRQYLIQKLLEMGLQPIHSHTNFVMVECPEKWDLNQLKLFLKEKKILVRGPWTTDPFKNSFRVTCGSIELMDRFLAALTCFASSTGRSF